MSYWTALKFTGYIAAALALIVAIGVAWMVLWEKASEEGSPWAAAGLVLMFMVGGSLVIWWLGNVIPGAPA